jgi:hypothetical protein
MVCFAGPLSYFYPRIMRCSGKAEKATKTQSEKRSKRKRNVISHDTESEEDDKEEAWDESESDVEDCIIVDVE